MIEKEMAAPAWPRGRVPLVLDTDTYNEVDDQFALCYCLLSSDRIDLRAVCAAPFVNARARTAEEGMEQSLAEARRLIRMLGKAPEGFLFGGSKRFMDADGLPVDSPAARELVHRAMAQPEGEPLYVAAIGAITNVASALRIRPEIARRIVVLWLGGHAVASDGAQEFNLRQDMAATQTVLDSGAALVIVPCQGVASGLVTSVPELRACIGGSGPLCDALTALVEDYSQGRFGWGKVIWDVAAIGYLVDEAFTRSEVVPCPVVGPDGVWRPQQRGRPVRLVRWIDRNRLFCDLFTKLSGK